jgi:hypothetical protein
MKISAAVIALSKIGPITQAAKTFGDAGPKQDASAAGVVDYYRLSLLAWLASRWKPDVLS